MITLNSSNKDDSESESVIAGWSGTEMRGGEVILASELGFAKPDKGRTWLLAFPVYLVGSGLSKLITPESKSDWIWATDKSSGNEMKGKGGVARVGTGSSVTSCLGITLSAFHTWLLLVETLFLSPVKPVEEIELEGLEEIKRIQDAYQLTIQVGHYFCKWLCMFFLFNQVSGKIKHRWRLNFFNFRLVVCVFSKETVSCKCLVASSSAFIVVSKSSLTLPPPTETSRAGSSTPFSVSKSKKPLRIEMP